MYLIVGLGNPGRKYAQTRHNIGFWLLDALASRIGVAFRQEQASFAHATGVIDDTEVVLLKPQTYMNLSGAAVHQAVERWHIELERLLIVYDDFNLPFGKLRLRAGGSDGGHNGMASIIAELQSQAFPRLRLGIGPARPGEEAKDFVLSPFSEEEQEHVPHLVDVACEATIEFVKNGVHQAMSLFNGYAILS